MLLAGVDLHRWGWVFGFLTLTGLRRSEFCGLRWSEVHLGDGYIDVKWRRTTAGSDVVEGAPKTRRARRRVPLDPMAARLLAARSQQRDHDRLAWGPDWCLHGDEYVWSFEDGSLPHPDRLTSEFGKFCAKIDITPCGLHGLRHTFAAAAIAAGVAPYALSRALGHSQVGFTYQVYGHLWDDGLVEELGKITQMLVVRRGFSDAIEGGSSSLDLGDDVVDGLGPHERLRVVVPV